MTRKELIQIVQESGNSELNSIKFVNALYEAVCDQHADLATTPDILMLKLELKSQMAEMKSDLQESLMKHTGFTVGVLSAMLALFKFIH